MSGSIWMNAKKTGGLFFVFLLLLCGAVILFLIAGEDYYTYLFYSVESAAAAPVISKKEAEQLDAPLQERLNTEVRFRNFFITFPGAKKVELQADFNSWGKIPLELKPYSKGYFEISVALPAGDYKYVFVVDGKDVLDPNNLDRTEHNGRKVCIKTVK